MGWRRTRVWSVATAGVTAVLLAPAVARAAPPNCSPATGLVANVQAGESIALPAAPCTDSDGDAISIEVTQAPTLGTLDPAGTQPIGTQRTYTANDDAGGETDTIKFRAVAGGETSNEATLQINISENHAPVCPANLARTVASGSQLVIDQNPCTDADSDVLTYVIADQPAHGTISGPASNGSYTYTPSAGYVGADSLTYRAQDASTQSNLGTFSITVTQGNRAPTCADSAVTVVAGSSIVLGAAPCSDPDGDALTLVLVRAPQHGTLDASRRYTPAAGYVGADTIQYRASDGRLQSAVATVRITVKRATGNTGNTGGGGATTPPPAVVPPAPDVTAPALQLAAPQAKQALQRVLKRGVTVTLTTGEPGQAVVRLLLSRHDARRLGINRKAKRAVAVGKLSRTLAAGQTSVAVKLTKKARQRLARVKTVKLTLEATITDAAGNVRRVTRVITLKRRN